jgi:LmbE family N-acetylglucosaminyl deacetylase
MGELCQLRGRALVLVAHPDDESIGCGILLQRMQHPLAVFATDGAPRDQQFWRGSVSREEYAQQRKREALLALGIAGVQQAEFLGDYGPEIFVDQELFRHMPAALDVLARIVRVSRPQALLTHAYEGGHPDHDCCSYLACVLGCRFGLPVWEMPLYYNIQEPNGIQKFMVSGEGEVSIVARREEASRKSLMVQSYGTQREFLQNFGLDLERFRPQPAYDYSRRPHEGVLNYEAWGWPITGSDVCAAFMQLQPSRVEPRISRATRTDRLGHRAGA